MGDRDIPRIERFDPLLRDLVAWGLVTKSTTTEKPTWRLTDAAQRRLDELITPTRPLNPDQLVYLDHLCAECRLRGRTRLRDGRYLCDDCLARHPTAATTVEAAPHSGAAAPDPALSKGHWRRSRSREDGSKPLAG